MEIETTVWESDWIARGQGLMYIREVNEMSQYHVNICKDRNLPKCHSILEVHIDFRPIVTT